MVFMVLCGVNFNLYYLAFKDGISQLFKDSEFRFYLLIFGVSALMICNRPVVTARTIPSEEQQSMRPFRPLPS